MNGESALFSVFGSFLVLMTCFPVTKLLSRAMSLISGYKRKKVKHGMTTGE